jgi:RNA polymerase sigma factor FliA
MAATLTSTAPTSTSQRLTSSEAEALWRNWKTRRDTRSRDRLVLAYAPMVRYIASRKLRELPAHCDVDDLASAGLVALLETIDRFDPAKGASFEQYAWTRVAGALVDELRKQDWASRSVRREGRRIERARDSFFARHGNLPTEAELAAELGTTVGGLRATLEDIDRSDVGSLNAPARGADDSVLLEVGETIQAPAGDHEPEATVLGADRSAAMRAAIERLSEREREVLALVHVQELPGAEIGRMLGVSESRVSQILSAIRSKLKHQLDTYDAAAAA